MKAESKAPAKRLGILGSGQLGRMSAMAAARLGITTHIYAPDPSGPATQVCARHFCGDYEDKAALQEFAQSVDVISYEFENIPVETVNYLQNFSPVYPGDNLLDISQNRLKEKAFLNSLGIETARWSPVRSPEDIKNAMQSLDISACIIKTTRFGYDGKGQIFHRDKDNTLKSWQSLTTEEAILEEVVDFEMEISVIVARDLTGRTVTYPPVMNEHQNHILSKTTYPAPLTDGLAEKATAIAVHLADSLELVGVCALEMFVAKTGQIVANEIAPRPHNSGHWTIDACAVSQFENHVRCVCGLPAGAAEPKTTAQMINLIGDDIEKAQHYLQQNNACVHLYGKDEARPGRKMGHVTILDSKEK